MEPDRHLGRRFQTRGSTGTCHLHIFIHAGYMIELASKDPLSSFHNILIFLERCLCLGQGRALQGSE